jgi:hypothetical protein
MDSALRQLEALLRKYRRDFWADRALEVQSILVKHGVKEACLATRTWWGGMGSMNDNYLYSADRALSSSAEELQDNRAFRLALLAVCEAIEANAITMPNAEACAATFREWEKSGVYDR